MSLKRAERSIKMITEKTQRARRPRGEWFWQAMVAACGNHCCAPGCMNAGPLEQGHIEAHDHGGYDDPENLIPLCRSCNAKFKNIKLSGDGRPDGWRERFFELIAYKIQPKFRLQQANGACYMLTTNQGIENTPVVAWRKPDFGPVEALFTSSQAARKTALDLVEEIKRESHTKQTPPNLPNEARGRQLVKLAESDPRGFLPTCREFLRRADFMRGDDHVRDDSWGPLCANYQTYRRWAVEHRNEIIQARRTAEREERASNFLSILYVPTGWEGLTDDERAWRNDAESRREAAGDATADECKRNHDVLSRYQQADAEKRQTKAKLEHLQEILLHGCQAIIDKDSFYSAYPSICDNLFYDIRNAHGADELKPLDTRLDELIATYKGWDGQSSEADQENSVTG